MNKPVRVHLSRKKGWRLPANTVSVSRPGPWGNPWKVGLDGDAQHCVDELRRLLLGEPCKAWPLDPKQAQLAMRYGDVDYMRALLRGKNLACWCKPGEPCHADVFLELANQGEQTVTTLSNKEYL